MGQRLAPLTEDALESMIAATAEPGRLLVWEPEAQLQKAIRWALGPDSEHWEASFVATVDELRAALSDEDQVIDVVLVDAEAVSTIASMLAEVALRRPRALRVVVGRPGADAAMADAAGAAHRFEPRPFDMPVLLDDLARTLRRREALDDHGALDRALGTTGLPSPPQLWLKVAAAVRDPEMGAAEVGAIVESDVAIAARALALANSAWFGLPRRVVDVRDAVVLLGGEAAQALVLAAELASSLGEGVDPAWLEAFEVHAAAVAHACTVVAPPALRQGAMAAGLLHDVGSLVLRLHHHKVMEVAETLPMPERLELERDLVGATHAEVGAMLLAAWGLPDALVDAVLAHQDPQVGLLPKLDLAGVVHVAEALVRDREGTIEAGLAYLGEIEHQEWLEVWADGLRG